MTLGVEQALLLWVLLVHEAFGIGIFLVYGRKRIQWKDRSVGNAWLFVHGVISILSAFALVRRSDVPFRLVFDFFAPLILAIGLVCGAFSLPQTSTSMRRERSM
jgi:hypothetical protein